MGKMNIFVIPGHTRQATPYRKPLMAGDNIYSTLVSWNVPTWVRYVLRLPKLVEVPTVDAVDAS